MPFDLTRGAPANIAIIGGGIAGLACGWALCRHHRVTLYEAERRFGGHARTVLAGARGDRAVDTGFIVFNYATYPHLTAMFRDLNVPVEKSDMSFGASLQGGRLEYALRSGNAIFGQRSNLVDPGFHGMLRDILRFNRQAADLPVTADMTIGELLVRLRLGRRFREHYLYPLCGAIWSTPPAGIDAFPAEALLRFLRNHALMAPRGQHQWWTVSGGSTAYLSRLIESLRSHGVEMRPGTPVRSVTRGQDAVTVRGEGALSETYDHVIFACHADQTMALLADADPAEIAAFSSIRFQPNRMVLHRDPRVMPHRRRCWSSWTHRTEAGVTPQQNVSVSYWMNRLQNIPESDPLFVTLNPQVQLPDSVIYDEAVFHHPLFDRAALAAQGVIAGLQGKRRSWFAGAWLRNGFHEDGFASALRVARQLLPEEV
ncbi:NAD(P)/FAD-dependent oxidoreductase [Haematobacter genomosp. 1]|uniref:Cyclopropane-fatty-acyl-phospholipid synthase n=1 Tax=Haematobacter genomosp. 1 TaxID=366618 RepID=A0A212ADQ3_9RHOB|nr:FAD-dependent oxidoreductase [Haematobacter genomosp. 1]OWJ79391.1 cyclopropane-fatty-acyl-phospholipid synthase [Haematobacter genomosp. 1]